ncbi:hypothetical protein NQ317_014562 [Molorchus minor]|uniref:Uncharacterized protein n=1 Tax=Molorchus minor TaxID=1323400 RepID=A0ABQ9JTN7_9CUCU|nr:hypothetical protein NQ317_014562 [Molorchus minor]
MYRFLRRGYILPIWNCGQATYTILKLGEKNPLKEMSIFTVRIYKKIWFTAPLASCAPNTDLELIKNLMQYDNPDIVKATEPFWVNQLLLQPFGLFICNLLLISIAPTPIPKLMSNELVGLCFFNSNVSMKTKRKIVHGMMINSSPHIRVVRPKLDQHDFQNLQLHDLANRNPMKIFNVFGVKEFYKIDVSVSSTSELGKSTLGARRSYATTAEGECLGKALTADKYLDFLQFDLIPALAITFPNQDNPDIPSNNIWM